MGNQISPTTNPKGTTYKTNDGDYNDQEFINYGRLEISGTLTNNAGGTLTNKAGGRQNFSQESAPKEMYYNLDNNGTMTNEGTMTFEGPSLNYYYLVTLSNEGTLNNSGTLKFRKSSLVFQNGTLNNNAGGTLINETEFDQNLTLNNKGIFTNKRRVANYGTLNNKAGGTLVNKDSFFNGTKLNNEKGGTLTNEKDGKLSYRITVINAGTLNNYGNLVSTNAGRQDWSDPTILTNDGTLNNYGTIENVADTTLTNNGTLDNDATLNNAGMLYNGATLTNYLTLNNKGYLRNQAGGTLNNDGSLTNYLTLDNIGNLYNKSGGTLDNDDELSNYGTLTNEEGGTLYNTGNLYNKSVGTLNNYGILDLTNVGRQDTILTNDGTLNNYGTLNNHATLNNTWGTLTNSGTLTNEAGGTLNNKRTLDNDATLNNYGTLNNDATLDNYDKLTNAGTLNNDATLNNRYQLFNEGTLDNDGTLRSDVTLTNEEGGTLDNDGTLRNDGTLTNKAGGTLNNKGNLYNKAGGTLNNYGILDSTNVGRQDTILTNDGTLNNYGTLNNDATLDNTWGTLTKLTNDGTLNNYGALNNDGILINQGTLKNEGTLLNYGTITGSGEIIGDITNNGTISPGNSAGGHLFTGNFYHLDDSIKKIELAGLHDGNGVRTGADHDWLEITGDLVLAGALEVSLIDGFQLSTGDSFVIAKVGGDLIGRYDDLKEGDSVGTFKADADDGGSLELFITYEGGDGNDVELYSKSIVGNEASDHQDFVGNSFDYKFFNQGNNQYGIQSDAGGEIVSLGEMTTVNFDDQAFNLSEDVKDTFDQVTGMNDVSGQMFRLYNTVFDRLADVNGLKGSIEVNREAVKTYREIATEFLQSEEFKSLYGETMSDQTFITTLYSNALDRDADAEGLAHYERALSSGEKTREQVVFDISESPEHKEIFTAITGLTSSQALFSSNALLKDSGFSYGAGSNDLNFGETKQREDVTYFYPQDNWQVSGQGSDLAADQITKMSLETSQVMLGSQQGSSLFQQEQYSDLLDLSGLA
ncbi:DUF4214 domain-containing protein [Prochlorococcus sp. MIT 1300]|uniref:DUF4214 domain-containing protein n=1 Tax=Prochlorococcus sp. MIT 1300 TaxID=3096218 RepID=UPI002A762B04|nr:DUF4214 domain-containing protein [Prochlorococcus sp. MIT 1300]